MLSQCLNNVRQTNKYRFNDNIVLQIISGAVLSLVEFKMSRCGGEKS